MIFPVLIGLVVVLLTGYVWTKTARPKNFPPGPIRIPFIGNLLSMGAKPHLTILRWKEKYGDIFGFHDGKKFFVVLSNLATVRRVFGEDTASGRVIPNATIARNDDSPLPLSVGLITSQGDRWKIHRRFALSTLRDLGMGKNWLEDSIVEEVDGIIKVLAATKEEPFNPKVMLTNSVSNVICALAFGKRFALDDPIFTRLTGLIAESLTEIKIEFIARVFPFLMWFPNPVRWHVKRSCEIVVQLKDFLTEIVADHSDGLTNGRPEAEDYLSAYQKEQETGSKTKAKETFDDQQLLGSLYDLFVAGTETTSTTTLWAMVFMIEHPDIMSKVQAEIDGTVGRDRMITMSDRALLPYTEAVVLESQRCGNLVPMAIPHRCHEEMIIDGYTIPKGTMVLANLFSIQRDTRYWKDPLTFNPTRFLDENNKLLRPEGFVPFSIGKRACLGEALARMELFLFIANILRVFTLQLPAGRTLSHEDYYASMVNSPNPFELIFVPRALN